MFCANIFLLNLERSWNYGCYCVRRNRRVCGSQRIFNKQWGEKTNDWRERKRYTYIEPCRFNFNTVGAKLCKWLTCGMLNQAECNVCSNYICCPLTNRYLENIYYFHSRQRFIFQQLSSLLVLDHVFNLYSIYLSATYDVLFYHIYLKVFKSTLTFIIFL